MAKKTKTRRSRFADDAALQALVRFGPEETGLQALAQQARADYGVSVRQAQNTGDLTLAAAKEAIPAVAKIYDQAGLDQAKTASLVSPELAALTGPAAGVMQRGGALEVAQQLANLRSSKASALEDLNTRQVAARQGQQFGVLNARQKFEADMQKILAQSQGLAQQKGAFTASTINSLLQSSLERGVKKRGQDKTAEAAQARVSATLRGQDLSHADRVASREAQAAKAAKDRTATGRKLNPAGDHATVRNQIGEAVATLKTLDPSKDLSQWGPLGNLLQTGHQSVTLKDPVTGKDRISKGGVPVKTPDVPKVGSLAARVALDLHFHGGISRETKKRLADAGYSVKELGLAGKPIPKRKPARKPSGRRAAQFIPATR